MFIINLNSQDHHRIIKIVIAMTILLLNACSDTKTTDSKHHHSPQAIESGDECHLCGMAITQFPGPKGQMHNKHNNKVKKFCSTNDLFAFILQPENKHNVSQAFVHDMGDQHWEKPNDAKMIDIKSAWFVKGHKLRGAMGPTLASFSSQEKAELFIKLNGGELIRFDQINLEILASLTGHHS